VLATTTSTDQTGLLDALLPDFTEKTGIEVKVVAVGTGQALEMGKNGEADVVLVHAKASEEQFVEEGYGVERFDVMYNDFVLLGAEPLPEALKNDIIGAFQYLSSEEKTFVSRGDDSGTHKKELAIWKAAGIEPSGDWYVSAGKGMGDVIQMADEMQAYTLSDRGTYLSMRNNVELQIVVEKATDLLNQYGVIAVNPDKNPGVHIDEANQFVQWILSKETQEKIAEFGIEEFGQALFVPNAKE
jgi:tungstate transport system substrate-binding protein